MFIKLHEPCFRAPRVWSNTVLRKVAPFLSGRVVNVSAWRDEDKESMHYSDYFSRATEYWLTNFKAEARGWQHGLERQIFLDLEQPLTSEMKRRFDIVFNHTTLEHVFDIFTAFDNLCDLSRDIVVLVVPFMQEQHGEYGDYWRFTPWCLQRLFKRSGLEIIFLDANEGSGDSIYLFVVASRHPNSWEEIRAIDGNRIDQLGDLYIGKNGLRNSVRLVWYLRAFRNLFGRQS